MNDAEQIGFGELVTQLARGYERRPAAEAAVEAAAAGAAPRCVLVCGEPGSGKSALAAHFIKQRGWCCHFLRIGHTEFTLWRDPYAFLTSLAFQLLAAYGEEIFPDSAIIDVNGSVRDVANTGAVVGVDLQRLVAVPWRRERFKVDLNARGIAGEVTGIRIGEMVENYRSVPLPAFRELAWFEPLRRLRAINRKARVTLWIDGLDEELAAMTKEGADGHRPATSIASLLPLDSECRAIGNLSLIISSRRGAHLARFVSDGAVMVELDAPTLSADTRSTLVNVIDRELADPRSIAALAALKWPAGDVRGALLGRSEGNFLFVRQYFEALRAGYGAALRDGGMPHGLDDIHARILAALVRHVPAAERLGVLAVLDVLAVAQTALSAEQLARFARIGEATVHNGLGPLQPLLDETADEMPPRFSLYHKSLRDCLVDPRHGSAPWHVNTARAHRRIAAAYFQSDGTASRIDGYGVLHGATHLIHAVPDGPDTLLTLLHDGWRRFCRECTGSNQVFRDGLELARQHAATLAPAEACLRLVRLGLADVYIRSAESAIPEIALEMMVRLGQVQRALEIAPNDAQPVNFARRHAAIIRGLLADPREDPSLAARLAEQVLEKLRLLPEWLEPQLSLILEDWPLEKADALREVLPSLEAALMSPSSGGARALAAIARIRTVLEPPSANTFFQQAFDAALRNGITDAAAIVGRVFPTWARFDAPAAREHLQRHNSFPTTRTSAAGFMELGTALDQAGWPGTSVHHANLLLGVPVQPGRDPLEAAGIWLQVVVKAPTLCPPATAAQIVDRVQGVLEKARADRAGAGKAAPASAAELALRVELAVAERACQRARDENALADAWQVLFEGADAQDDDLGLLVRLQAKADREALEAYLETAPENLRDRLWLAVLREGVLPGNPGPAKALERMTLAAEKPRPTGWSMFYYAAAECSPEDRLDSSEKLLRQIGVYPFAMVRWRVAIFRRLLAANSPRAGEWLGSTIGDWAGPGANRNFVDELPAAVAELPEPLLAAVEPHIGEVGSSKRRALLRIAVASAKWPRDPAQSRAELDAVLAEPADPNDPADFGDYVVLAFLSGQLWSRDAVRAAQIWDTAMARLERVFGGASEENEARYFHYCAMLRALHWGAPAAAAEKLLAISRPPPTGGARIIMMPFPGVSPFRMANLPEHEFLLGAALVRALPRHRDQVLAMASQPLSETTRAYVLPELARAATGVPLPQRMAWCRDALNAAQQVGNVPLRSLLLAGVAAGNAQIGAKARGLEIAGRVVTTITPHLTPGDTLLAHVFGATLGRCVGVAIRCEAWSRAWEWLWHGRTLGMHGFYVTLGELPVAMQGASPVSLDHFEAAEAAGRNFYCDA